MMSELEAVIVLRGKGFVHVTFFLTCFFFRWGYRIEY